MNSIFVENNKRPHANAFVEKHSFFLFSDYDTRLSKSEHNRNEMNPAIEKAVNALKFVAQHVKNEDNFNSVS